MRGLDIGGFSRKNRYNAPVADATILAPTTLPHVAASAPHEQRCRLGA
jgi:hypothetical protein